MYGLRLGISSFRGLTQTGMSLKPLFRPNMSVLRTPIARSIHHQVPKHALNPTSMKSTFKTMLQKRVISFQNYGRQTGGNRLLKPFLFATVFSVVTYFAVPYIYQYTPMSYFKKHPSHLVWGLIGMNVAVFGLWYLKYRNVRLYRMMENYFIMDRLGGTSNWSMVLSTFSHQEPFHLLVNMGCLYSFSGTMLSVLGVPGFTSLYLISGIWSSMASLCYAQMFKNFGRSLGASGAIAGVFTCFATLFPTAGVSLFFFPIPGGAITAAGLFAGYNVAGCLLRWGSFDYAAHLGGMAIGTIWGIGIKQKLEREERERRDRLRRYGF